MSGPDASEYAPYYGRYISLVPSRDVLEVLAAQPPQTRSVVSKLDGDYRYAPDKWSVKEIVGHLIDTERIFGYRALRIARNDPKPMEGFEQDDYVRSGNFGACKLRDLIDEFECVRHATLFLLRKLDPQAWLRRGVANESQISVRALAYIIAGHELHHRGVLEAKYRR
jgi:uncharacterized damage-inducible protein DinB